MAPTKFCGKNDKHYKIKNKKFPLLSGWNSRHLQKEKNRYSYTKHNWPKQQSPANYHSEHIATGKRLEKNIAITKRTEQYSSDNHPMNIPNENKMCMLNVVAAWANYAENFAAGVSWQQNWHIAYWKSRAECLEFENRKLRKIISTNIAVPTTSKAYASDSESEYSAGELSDHQSEDSRCEINENDTEVEEKNKEENDEQNELEVSEEYIQFLIYNSKFREDAKYERERLKKSFEVDSEPDVHLPKESKESMVLRKKNVYGENYNRIVALELYLISGFQEAKNNAIYWPNIPLNIQFS